MPYLSATISDELDAKILSFTTLNRMSKAELMRNAVASFVENTDPDEPAVVVPYVVETPTNTEEEDTMNFDATTDVRLHKNESGSVSLIAYDRITGEKKGTLARLQNDGTLRRIKNHGVPAFSADDDGRIAIDETPMRRNLNR